MSRRAADSRVTAEAEGWHAIMNLWPTFDLPPPTSSPAEGRLCGRKTDNPRPRTDTRSQKQLHQSVCRSFDPYKNIHFGAIKIDVHVCHFHSFHICLSEPKKSLACQRTPMPTFSFSFFTFGSPHFLHTRLMSQRALDTIHISSPPKRMAYVHANVSQKRTCFLRHVIWWNAANAGGKYAVLCCHASPLKRRLGAKPRIRAWALHVASVPG